MEINTISVIVAVDKVGNAPEVTRLLCFQPSKADAENLVKHLNKQTSEFRRWLKITANETGESVVEVDESKRGIKRRLTLIDGYVPVDSAHDHTTYIVQEIGECCPVFVKGLEAPDTALKAKPNPELAIKRELRAAQIKAFRFSHNYSERELRAEREVEIIKLGKALMPDWTEDQILEAATTPICEACHDSGFVSSYLSDVPCHDCPKEEE
jgi:hypothetical protein